MIGGTLLAPPGLGQDIFRLDYGIQICVHTITASFQKRPGSLVFRQGRLIVGF